MQVVFNISFTRKGKVFGHIFNQALLKMPLIQNIICIKVAIDLSSINKLLLNFLNQNNSTFECVFAWIMYVKLVGPSKKLSVSQKSNLKFPKISSISKKVISCQN